MKGKRMIALLLSTAMPAGMMPVTSLEGRDGQTMTLVRCVSGNLTLFNAMAYRGDGDGNSGQPVSICIVKRCLYA